MDVEAAWMGLAEAIQRDEWEAAAEHAEDIPLWLDREGFPPTITGQRSFDKIAGRAVCRSIAQ